MKINVLIVDDEKIVREGLQKYVDWEKYNMNVIGTAESGNMALDIVNNGNVDLVITDIYMPELDGIELISCLSDLKEKPLVVLISGYDDFKFAQTALRTDIVQDYILKPLNFEQLDKALSGVMEKINQNDQNVFFPILDKDEWVLFSNTSRNNVVNNQQQIMSKIEVAEIEDAIKMFMVAFQKLIDDKVSRNFIARYCIEVALNTSELVLGKVESKKLLEKDPITYIARLKNVDDMKKYVIETLKTADSALNRMENNNVSPLIRSVLKYVNKRYTDNNISLNLIANHYNTSPSYMSTKFKEQVGINFIKYLNELRVKKAKKLLEDTSLKVYDVSNKVGYDDVRYFSRIFRTYTGYTPTGYQKKVVKCIDEMKNNG
ncbi:response regulator transcription factor [Vallitalea maricola]|uniref:Uncharacterized protein n=1 Tax=Vallitalea maricola TaxID=3074433 RepID=A0ACB5ULX4_9FIRM|nr:hypothetical protein AN2V17_28560 [Vallitalea sp. AN17-2]